MQFAPSSLVFKSLQRLLFLFGLNCLAFSISYAEGPDLIEVCRSRIAQLEPQADLAPVLDSFDRLHEEVGLPAEASEIKREALRVYLGYPKVPISSLFSQMSLQGSWHSLNLLNTNLSMAQASLSTPEIFDSRFSESSAMRLHRQNEAQVLQERLKALLAPIRATLQQGKLSYADLLTWTQAWAQPHFINPDPKTRRTDAWNEIFPLGLIVPTDRPLDYWELHKWQAMGALPAGLIAYRKIEAVDGSNYHSQSFTDHDLGHALEWACENKWVPWSSRYKDEFAERRQRILDYLEHLSLERQFILRIEALRSQMHPNDFQLLAIMIHHLSHETGRSITWIKQGFTQEELQRVFLLETIPSGTFRVRRYDENDYAAGFIFASLAPHELIRELSDIIFNHTPDLPKNAESAPPPQ